MTQLTPLDLVLDTLQLVVASPEHRPTQLAARFSADYRQQVDGKVLNFEQFEQHMALLKRQTRRMTLSVIAAAAQGEAVLTHHLVELESAMAPAAACGCWRTSPCVRAAFAPVTN